MKAQPVQMVFDHLYGVLGLGFWGYLLAALVVMHITLIAITLFYHREQAHRSVDLHPLLQHFFRFWLWLNTGAITKEWVAVHRKHHAMCETEGDPHSPQVYGLGTVLLRGAELYRREAKNRETLEKYGRGTPDDWLERHLYTRWPNLGIASLLFVDLFLFGVPGIILYAVQLTTMPLLAAGVINGLSHAKGYRNFETLDASTNLWPIAVFVAGEELHNNHHAFPSSAKFSQRPWEVDIGWLHLKLFSVLGLAKIRRVAPRPELVEERATPDLDALRAILINRMHVLRHYSQSVTLPVLRRELGQLGDNANSLIRRAKSWLARHPSLLDPSSQERLGELMDRHPSLKTVVEFRNELRELWEGAHTSNERLLADLKRWCVRAEESGIQALEEFAAYLKSFSPVPQPAVG